jgi:hypothetical protein
MLSVPSWGRNGAEKISNTRLDATSFLKNFWVLKTTMSALAGGLKTK